MKAVLQELKEKINYNLQQWQEQYLNSQHFDKVIENLYSMDVDCKRSVDFSIRLQHDIKIDQLTIELSARNG